MATAAAASAAAAPSVQRLTSKKSRALLESSEPPVAAAADPFATPAADRADPAAAAAAATRSDGTIDPQRRRRASGRDGISPRRATQTQSAARSAASPQRSQQQQQQMQRKTPVATAYTPSAAELAFVAAAAGPAAAVGWSKQGALGPAAAAANTRATSAVLRHSSSDATFDAVQAERILATQRSLALQAATVGGTNEYMQTLMAGVEGLRVSNAYGGDATTVGRIISNPPAQGTAASPALVLSPARAAVAFNFISPSNPRSSGVTRPASSARRLDPLATSRSSSSADPDSEEGLLNLASLARFLTPAQAQALAMYPQLLVQALCAAKQGEGINDVPLLAEEVEERQKQRAREAEEGYGRVEAPVVAVTPNFALPTRHQSTRSLGASASAKTLGSHWDDSFAAPKKGGTKETALALFGAPPPLLAPIGVRAPKTEPAKSPTRASNLLLSPARMMSPTNARVLSPMAASAKFAASPTSSQFDESSHAEEKTSFSSPSPKRAAAQSASLAGLSPALRNAIKPAAMAPESGPDLPPPPLHTDLTQNLLDLGPTPSLEAIDRLSGMATAALGQGGASAAEPAKDREWDMSAHIERALSSYLAYFSAAREKYHLPLPATDAGAVPQSSNRPVTLYTSTRLDGATGADEFALPVIDAQRAKQLQEELERKALVQGRWLLSGFTSPEHVETVRIERVKPEEKENHAQSQQLHVPVVARAEESPSATARKLNVAVVREEPTLKQTRGLDLSQLHPNSAALGRAGAVFAPKNEMRSHAEVALSNPASVLNNPIEPAEKPNRRTRNMSAELLVSMQTISRQAGVTSPFQTTPAWLPTAVQQPVAFSSAQPSAEATLVRSSYTAAESSALTTLEREAAAAADEVPPEVTAFLENFLRGQAATAATATDEAQAQAAQDVVATLLRAGAFGGAEGAQSARTVRTLIERLAVAKAIALAAAPATPDMLHQTTGYSPAQTPRRPISAPTTHRSQRPQALSPTSVIEEEEEM